MIFIKSIYKKYERWVPIVFFALGFLFDATVLHRIDEPAVIAQQAVYLLICAFLIAIELIETRREIFVPFFLRKVWKYREPLLHFLLGTLLNVYTIFYFKSASALTSLLFIAVLVVVLILNEFQRFGKRQTQVHMAFLSLCLISYLVSLAPILFGFIGDVPFLCANGAALALVAIFYLGVKSFLADKPSLTQSHIMVPFGVMQITFAILYFFHAIPPVPLSVTYMGIYHEVKREQGNYQLIYTRSKWRFWEHGDQHFLARPNDTIHCFASVFSPAKFKDKLQVRWLYYDAKAGWKSSDAIPLEITGGREEGYRGVTRKSNYQPGKWRVQIETMDNREVGRIGFTVESDDDTAPREVSMIVQ